jgi:hypothetical protein
LDFSQHPIGGIVAPVDPRSAMILEVIDELLALITKFAKKDNAAACLQEQKIIL